MELQYYSVYLQCTSILWCVFTVYEHIMVCIYSVPAYYRVYLVYRYIVVYIHSLQVLYTVRLDSLLN